MSIWVICLCSGVAGHSQISGIGNLLSGYFIRHGFPFDSGKKQIAYTNRFEYTLSPNCLILINWAHDGRISSIDMGQSFRYQCMMTGNDVFRLTGSFLHNLGFQYFFDSELRVNTDDNSISARMEVAIRRQLSFTLASLITTRLLNGFDYRVNDSGAPTRVLNSSFLTPAVLTLSCGLGYGLKNFGSLNLGITSAKFTYILNKNIFFIRDVSTYYGIDRGKDHLLEYGILFQLLINKEIMKSLHWDCDLRVFRNYGALPIDISLKNMFGLRINRFLKVMLQTKILYEEKISRHLQVENLFSVGFSVQM